MNAPSDSSLLGHMAGATRADPERGGCPSAKRRRELKISRGGKARRDQKAGSDKLNSTSRSQRRFKCSARGIRTAGLPVVPRFPLETLSGQLPQGARRATQRVVTRRTQFDRGRSELLRKRERRRLSGSQGRCTALCSSAGPRSFGALIGFLMPLCRPQPLRECHSPLNPSGQTTLYRQFGKPIQPSCRLCDP